MKPQVWTSPTPAAGGGSDRAVKRGGPATRPRPAVSDEILVRRCVNERSEDAFTQLFRRHQKGILNYIFRMTGSYDLALELTQEVFVRAFQSLDRFDSRYRFTTWIYHIASNRTIDHLRKKRPWHTSIGHQDSRDGRITPPALRSRRPSPYEEMRAKELNRKIQAEIQRLPPTYRDLIVLRHFNHLRYDEIARIRRLPLGTVKNRIFRARELLRRAVFPETRT